MEDWLDRMMVLSCFCGIEFKPKAVNQIYCSLRCQRRIAKYYSDYGIYGPDKQRMIREQEGKCKICNIEFKDRNFVDIDHDHITGRVRGILCRKCNIGLGWYEKNKEIMYRYLKGEK